MNDYPYPTRETIHASEDDLTIIPPDVHLAAKRGFVRTTAQSFAASIPTGGVAVGTVLGVIQNPDPWVIGATAIATVISPLLAGLASYLSIIGKGIPEAYQPTIETDPIGALTD